MNWTRSDTLALAANSCSRCHGVGIYLDQKTRPAPCGCVCRRIFRACYARFTQCVRQDRLPSHVSKHICSGPNRRVTWGMKNEEYIADFVRVSLRTLTGVDRRVFRFYCILGGDWKLCARRLQLDRGNFFHALYRMECRLGRTFRELEPFALYPLDEYFHGTHRIRLHTVQPETEKSGKGNRKRGPLTPPIRRLPKAA